MVTDYHMEARRRVLAARERMLQKAVADSGLTLKEFVATHELVYRQRIDALHTFPGGVSVVCDNRTGGYTYVDDAVLVRKADSAETPMSVEVRFIDRSADEEK